MRTRTLAILSLTVGLACGIRSALGEPKELPPEAIVRLTTGLDSSGNATHIHPVAFSPDGSSIAWGDRKDHTVRIWNVKTHQEEWKLHGHERHVLCTAYSADGNRLASGSYDGSVRIWDLLTGRTLKILRPVPKTSMVYTVAFSPDGKTLASGEWGGSFRLWDLESGKLLHSAHCGGPQAGKSRRAFVQVLAFSPDGKTVVTGAEGGAVQFWDVATSKEREKLRKVIPPAKNQQFASPYASSLDFSPDGKILAVAFYGTTQSIYLWDTKTGEEVKKLDGTGSAYTVDFSSDGKYLLSSARNLRVWELASGQTVLKIPEPRSLIYAMYSGSFSPDGTLLCSGGQDNAVILWDAFGFHQDWTPPEISLDKLERLWLQLGDPDPATAYRTVGILTRLGKPAVAVLREHLQAVAKADPDQVQKWVRELNADAFETRERAERELGKVGDLAEAAIRKALANRPAAETRMRARRLLKKVVPNALTRSRALIVLERVGSPDARRVLEYLAKGDSRLPLTQEARAAVGRLALR